MRKRSSIGASAVFCGLALGSGSALSQEMAPVSSTGIANAAPEELSLSYQVSDDCPGHVAFVTSFEQRLTEPSLILRSSSSVIDVSAHKEADHYRASLSIQLQGGEVLTRSIEASTCSQAVEAIAFVLAVALDPKSPEAIVVQDQNPAAGEGAAQTEEAPRQSPASMAPTAQANEAQRDTKDPDSAKPAGRSPTSSSAVERRHDAFVRLFAGPALTVGALPQSSFGGQASLEIGVAGGGFWSPSVRMGASAFAPVVVEHTLGDARFQFWTTQVEFCPSELSWRRLDFRPCGQLSLGRTSAEGSNTYEPNAVHRLWISLGASARLGLALHRNLRLSVGGSLDFPVTWDGYHFDESLVYETPPVAGSWSLGMELQFW